MNKRFASGLLAVGIFAAIPASSAETTVFSGQLGDYSSSGEMFFNGDCTFEGYVRFGGSPTGGTVNRIFGAVDGIDVTFTRELGGNHLGQTDQFKGTLAERGRKILGAWAGLTYEATLTPQLDACNK